MTGNMHQKNAGIILIFFFIKMYIHLFTNSNFVFAAWWNCITKRWDTPLGNLNNNGSFTWGGLVAFISKESVARQRPWASCRCWVYGPGKRPRLTFSNT